MLRLVKKHTFPLENIVLDKIKARFKENKRKEKPAQKQQVTYMPKNCFNVILLHQEQKNQTPLFGDHNQKGLIQLYPWIDNPYPAHGISRNEVISVTVQIILLNVKNVTNSPASANYDLPGLS